MKKRPGRPMKHGDAGLNSPGKKLYHSWSAMIQRCTNPRRETYKYYGGRGIKVFSLWRKSYIDFKEYVGQPPSVKHSLDRINNDGNYEPGNVRWATQSEQRNNSSTSVVISAFGKTLSMKDWASLVPIKYHTIKRRIQSGWAPELALSVPAVATRSYQKRT